MIARKLLILNFIAIVGTVIHHATHWVVTDLLFWWPEKFGSNYPLDTLMGQAALILLRIIDAIAIVAVPIFVLITGYTVTKVISSQVPLTKNYQIVLSRLRNILIPYLIWSAVWIIFRIWQGETFTIPDIIALILGGKAANEYYYIRILVQMYLIAPLWLRLARKQPWLVLGIAIVINLIARAPVYLYQLSDFQRVWWLSMFINWQAPTYLIWFTCGLIFGFHLDVIYAWIQAHRAQLFTTTALALVVVVIEVSWFSGQLGKPWMYSNSLLSSQIFSILLAACLVSLKLGKLPYQKYLMRLGTQSLGIYLIHSLILTLFAKGVFHVFPALLSQPYLFFFVLVLMGVGIPLAIMKLADITPMKRFSYVFFG
jgi:peptidoglycan/LPS O-acetylase OafA/YrhL